LNASTPIQNLIGLTVFGTSTFQGNIQINDGTAQKGKVLMANDSSGTASWVATSTLGLLGNSTNNTGGTTGSSTSTTYGGYTHMVVYSTPGISSWTVPSGVKYVMVEVWGAGGSHGYCLYVHGCPGIDFSPGNGGYAKGIYDVSSLTSVNVTVGSYGGFFVAGSQVGGDGSLSSFGNLISASGGLKGPTVSVFGGSDEGTGANGSGNGQVNNTGSLPKGERVNAVLNSGINLNGALGFTPVPNGEVVIYY
jgi:hypothetical protein